MIFCRYTIDNVIDSRSISSQFRMKSSLSKTYMYAEPYHLEMENYGIIHAMTTVEIENNFFFRTSMFGITFWNNSE